MPGLTLLISSLIEEGINERHILNAHEKMRHNNNYESSVCFSSPCCFLGYVAYPEYPIFTINLNNHLVIIEGKIYNKSKDSVEGFLRTLTKEFTVDYELALERVNKWVLEADGEYVVVVYSLETKRLLVFTDPLGRLPLYYYLSKTQFILSRECKFIVQFMVNPAYDRLGWAEYLWMGYPLGDRTLLKNVKRATGGFMVVSRVDAEFVSSYIFQTYLSNFDEKDRSEKNADHYASNLVELMVDAVRQRSAGFLHKVISLSGGQDSRAVAAALKKLQSIVLLQLTMMWKSSNTEMPTLRSKLQRY
jgi:asparagine synthetase B (glutamine-hydrolysing)